MNLSIQSCNKEALKRLRELQPMLQAEFGEERVQVNNPANLPDNLVILRVSQHNEPPNKTCELERRLRERITPALDGLGLRLKVEISAPTWWRQGGQDVPRAEAV